jgi:hypothetical protein
LCGTAARNALIRSVTNESAVAHGARAARHARSAATATGSAHALEARRIATGPSAAGLADIAARTGIRHVDGHRNIDDVHDRCVDRVFRIDRDDVVRVAWKRVSSIAGIRVDAAIGGDVTRDVESTVRRFTVHVDRRRPVARGIAHAKLGRDATGSEEHGE